MGEIFTHASQLAMRSYNNVAAHYAYAKYIKWLIVAIFSMVLYTHALILMTPYKGAKERMAYAKYKSTTLYRDRLVELGEQYALHTYIEHDRHLFLDKLTWRDKLKAIVIPYSCGITE